VDQLVDKENFDNIKMHGRNLKKKILLLAGLHRRAGSILLPRILLTPEEKVPLFTYF